MTREEELRILKAELSRRKAAESHPEKLPQSDRSRELDLLYAEAQRRGLNITPKIPTPEYSAPERVGQVARGPLAMIGGVQDLLSTVPYEGAKLIAPKLAESIGRMSGQEVTSQVPEEMPQASQLYPSVIDKAYGRDLIPQDTTGKVLQGIGEFLTPAPGGGLVNAARKGVMAGLGHVAKEVPMALGASAAVHATPRLAEEGTFGGIAEDLAKTVVGGAAGSLAGKLATTAVKELPNVMAHPIDSSIRGAAKVTSKLTKPNEEVINLAKKHDVDLPFNVGMNSTPLNFVANNYLKTMFVSKKYKEALEKSNDSMINAVRKKIDTLGERNLTPKESSDEFRHFLKEDEKIFGKQASDKYKEAKALYRDAQVSPSNTLGVLRSNDFKDLLASPSPSKGQKAVITRIAEIFGNLNSKTKIPDDVDPKYLAQIMEKTGGGPKVNVKDLISLRQSLLHTLNYDTDVRGVESFLSKLTRTIDSDIKRMDNKEALNKYLEANKFFKENIGRRFRESIAESVLKNNSPVDAFNLMNSVENINVLERVAGSSPKGREIFDSLKKAKVRQILGKSIEGDLRTEGSLKTGIFPKIFSENEKNQDVLKRLLGEKSYKELEELGKISKEFSKSGRELLNTSGTAHVLSDINASKELVKEALGTIGSIVGHGTAGFSVAGPGGAAATIFLPNAVSRLLANKKFISQLKSYALARQQNVLKNRKSSKMEETLLKSMVVTAVNDLHEMQQRSD